MTRSKPLAACLLTAVAMLTLAGCHTTVVQPQPAQPVAQPAPDHHDDHHPPPPPPDHHDDRPQDQRNNDNPQDHH